MQGVLEATDWALAPLKPRDDDRAVSSSLSGAAEQSAPDQSCAARNSGADAASHTQPSCEAANEAGNSPPAPQRRPAARRYPRKIPAPAQQREAEASAQFLATMRAHFQEVRAHLPYIPVKSGAMQLCVAAYSSFPTQSADLKGGAQPICRPACRWMHSSWLWRPRRLRHRGTASSHRPRQRPLQRLLTSMYRQNPPLRQRLSSQDISAPQVRRKARDMR